VSEADDLESIYLTIEDVLELYAAIIGGTTSEANDQLRNRPGLESAIGRPSAYAHYERADLATQAAVLARSHHGTRRSGHSTCARDREAVRRVTARDSIRSAARLAARAPRKWLPRLGL
jgi:hypothetical protein